MHEVSIRAKCPANPANLHTPGGHGRLLLQQQHHQALHVAAAVCVTAAIAVAAAVCGVSSSSDRASLEVTRHDKLGEQAVRIRCRLLVYVEADKLCLFGLSRVEGVGQSLCSSLKQPGTMQVHSMVGHMPAICALHPHAGHRSVSCCQHYQHIRGQCFEYEAAD